MRSIESSGKSIDEAIFNGLQQLEISIDEVEIEILQQESKGVLGIGARSAVVRLTEREPEEIVLPDYMQERPRERRDYPPRNDRDRRGARGPGSRGDRGGHGGRDNRDNRERTGERGEREPRKPAIAYSEELAANEPAAQFLSGMLEKMGVENRVLAAEKSEEDGVRLCIESATMGILIGHRGETLDAMQYITSLVVNRNRKEEGYTRVTLDTEGYREKREDTLTRLARKVAAQVKTTGKPRTLEPMNPYERRVLHATLQNNPYVTTHSEGEEPNRRVVVEPK